MKHITAVLVIFCIYRVYGTEEPDSSECPLRCTEERLLENMAELNNKMRETLDVLGRLEDSKTTTLNALEPYTWRSLLVSDLEVDGWQMVFRATSGNGHSAYKAWTKGLDVTNDKPVSMERSYATHYRHRNVPNWTNLGVKYVKFALYDHYREVAYVIFNGAGSDMNNWFTNSRVLSSSYSDLTASGTYNIFSIEADYRPNLLERRFEINTKYGGCDGDQGHLVTIETNPATVCFWDIHPVYPQFLYSKINSADYWNRRLFGRADYLAIFIKTA